MEEIKTILDKYDIAGMVVIHTPGFSENLLQIDPSYSCARILPGGIGLHFKNTDRPAAQRKTLAQDTANMFSLLADGAGHAFLAAKSGLEAMETRFDIKQGPTSHSSHEEQNN